MVLRILSIFFLLTAQLALAQQFRHTYTIHLPDSITEAKPIRADLNNDGLLDVLLITKSSAGKNYLQVVKGDTTITPFLHWQATQTIGPRKGHLLVDYNRDNRMDLVLSSTDGRVAVYLNQGNFVFAETQLFLPAFAELLPVDLDNDARSEWILSDGQTGTGKLMVYRQATAFAWTLAHDSTKITPLSIALTDQNSDGRTDVFVSGTVGNDSLVSSILLSDEKLHLNPSSKFEFSGKASGGDFNADGVFDFLLMGRDKQQIDGTRIFQSSMGSHIPVSIAIALNQATPFVADLNSDGIVDFNYQGLQGSESMNVVQYAMNNYDTIPSLGYRSHVFGDEDRDGDLDVLVLAAGDHLRLLAYENMTSVNKPPSAPKNAIVTRVFNRFFYYWDPAGDDRTPLQSITYDLYIDGTTGYAGEFDLLNEKRLSVTHGNNGTQNFKLLRVSNARQFAVQAIDNAFNSSRLCIGSSSACSSASVTKLTLCENEKHTVTAPHESLWFSFAKGFLGKRAAIELTASNDTVFYYDPAAKGCDALKVMQVQIGNNALRSVVEKYACAGQSLKLSVESGWSSVSWKSYKHGDLGTGSTINVVVSEADTITATMVSATGCTKKDKTVVRLSTPLITVSPDQVRIPVGSDVRLVASGGSRYEWTPASGLSSVSVADPVAAPAVTTSYLVTGYDSLGCAGTAGATVHIENGGYVPNLFTPNDDGKNDEIKIYGLTEVKDFQFTIHNREGAEIYRTNSLSDAMQKGWDGTKKGTKQPAGVYFWKVKGKLGSGDRLLLNGKDTGSIVLVR
ncbi:FG-GAP-like repeat-containing protein [Chryseolinea sp. T2]|uniref:FG-GAP-like repeat-containing protein n=1 Tax=Chryseolinea sp. T2 TaxID=3129255 RepID=UPI0030789A62